MKIFSSAPEFDLENPDYNTTEHLANARMQAERRGLDKVLIVDVDAHHYETDNLLPIIHFIEDPVLRQSALNMYQYKGSASVIYDQPGMQDVGGRINRYQGRKTENIDNLTGTERDIGQARRWMDALAVDYACLFPTPMLFLGLHPQVDIEVNLAKAYNRWMVEEVLPKSKRIKSMLYLPFNDPQATYEMVRKYAGHEGVIGFMVVSTRYKPVHHNDYAKTYALLEEANMPIAFHASYHWNDQLVSQANKFITAHALGFTFFNALHCANWVTNAMPEKFPRLKVIWVESGLAWIPWLMQRLDHDYRMRVSECPGLKQLPSDYMRQMYYTTQPMEMVNNREALELTFKMINAETQLMYSSDYPHWDMDLPTVIWDLPFLTEEAKRRILGLNAMELFNMDVSDRYPELTPKRR